MNDCSGGWGRHLGALPRLPLKEGHAFQLWEVLLKDSLQLAAPSRSAPAAESCSELLKVMAFLSKPAFSGGIEALTFSDPLKGSVCSRLPPRHCWLRHCPASVALWLLPLPNSASSPLLLQVLIPNKCLIAQPPFQPQFLKNPACCGGLQIWQNIKETCR